jgi:hypothetical protein
MPPHGQIRKGKPSLRNANAPHRLHREGQMSLVALGGAGQDRLDERRPWHHAFHLRGGLPFARAFYRQTQAEIGLLHKSDDKHVVHRSIQTILNRYLYRTC